MPFLHSSCARGVRAGTQRQEEEALTKHLLYLVTQFVASLCQSCFQMPPPSFLIRQIFLFLTPHLSGRCILPKFQIGVVQRLQRALWISGTIADTVTGPPS